jgi:hypothetical protein
MCRSDLLDLFTSLKKMNEEITNYNNAQTTKDVEICNLLAQTIKSVLSQAENKIWHAHPVWFLEGNPIVLERCRF